MVSILAPRIAISTLLIFVSGHIGQTDVVILISLQQDGYLCSVGINFLCCWHYIYICLLATKLQIFFENKTIRRKNYTLFNRKLFVENLHQSIVIMWEWWQDKFWGSLLDLSPLGAVVAISWERFEGISWIGLIFVVITEGRFFCYTSPLKSFLTKETNSSMSCFLILYYSLLPV